MKKLFATLLAVTAVASMASAQGRINFQNETTFSPTDAITIGAQNMGAAGGNAGWGIGGDKYSVQLLWVAGVATTQGQFDSLSPVASAVFTGPGVFLANTSDLANFSGFFDAGTPAMGTPAGTYTYQVLAWYNVGFATYNSAVGVANTGKSALFTSIATASPTPPNTTVFPGFTVGTVPEPGTLALAGLGAASLLLFRRKK